MSGLRSVLEEYRREEPAELPPAHVQEAFGELHRSAEVLEAERLRWLAVVDRQRSYVQDGHLSTASWLVATFGMSWGQARAQVRLARALRGMPRTMEALASGEVSSSAVRILASAHDAHPEAFLEHEGLLLEAAQSHRVKELEHITQYWAQAVASDRAIRDQEDLRVRRRLHVSPTVFGMVRVDGDLDPETGETLITALRAVQDADVRGGDVVRTPAQRRADALGEICRQWLDLSERPKVAGERPHITVTIDLEALVRRGGGTCELDHTGPILPEVARRLSCDASVTRIVLGPRSEPLDVGRRTPVVPPGMRRAVIVRDRHCRFPGCDRPQAWCDAHHVIHWADGGSTALSNLVLLCRRHHTMTHEGIFQLEVRSGRPVFRRSDGSVLEERAPPL
jgi:hypothetical protein